MPTFPPSSGRRRPYRFKTVSALTSGQREDSRRRKRSCTVLYNVQPVRMDRMYLRSVWQRVNRPLTDNLLRYSGDLFGPKSTVLRAQSEESDFLPFEAGMDGRNWMRRARSKAWTGRRRRRRALSRLAISAMGLYEQVKRAKEGGTWLHTLIPVMVGHQLVRPEQVHGEEAHQQGRQSRCGAQGREQPEESKPPGQTRSALVFDAQGCGEGRQRVAVRRRGLLRLVFLPLWRGHPRRRMCASRTPHNRG